MDEELRSRLIRSCSHYSSSPGLRLRYGVHGFVGDVSVLRSVAYRIGILAALRSVKSQSVTGVMIAACDHNVEKNGVRIVDPDGGALIAAWEPFADSVANAVDPEEVVTLIEEFVKKENISFDGGQPTEILLGRDTRPSGESLLEAAKQGLSSVSGAVFLDMGILTSPQLHWMVRTRNKGIKASEYDYFQQLSSNYRSLVDLIPEDAMVDKIGESLVVDGANGVGGDKIEALKNFCDGLTVEIRNTTKSGATINEGVGVDFIQEQKSFPSGFGPSDIGVRCASLDGDADRLLYFFVLPSHKDIEIVDGDKMLFLFTLFINEQLSVLEEVENGKEDGHYHAGLGILQSPYANGASIDYLKSLGIDVVFMPNGIESLHAEASKYDIAIYFETDGRGSILFSEDYLSWLEAKNNESLSSSKGSGKQCAASRLLAVSRLMNSTVADALAGLLLVEAILQHNGWSVQKWNELYCDLASRQINPVELVDRMAVAPGNTEIVSVSHSGTKEEADSLIVEARPQDAIDGSHRSQESKHIDTDPVGSEVQQIVDYEAQTVEQSVVDTSAELQESHGLGTTYIQSYENENEMHERLPVEVQERHESRITCLHSGETADEIKLEGMMEAEASQESCIDYMQSDKAAIALVSCSLESHMGASEDTCPAQVVEEADLDHVIDKERIEVERGEAGDDAWVLVSDGKEDCLNDDSVMTDTVDYQHLSELDKPSNEKEICSSPNVNGIHVPVGNADDLLVSADIDKAEEEAGVISGVGPASDTQPESQTSSSDGFLPAVVHDDKLGTKAQNGTVHVDNGTNGLIDSTSLDAMSCSCSEANDINVPIDSREALPILSDVGTTEELGVVNVVEHASHKISPSQVNVNVDALPSCDHVANLEAETQNSQVENGSNCLVDGKSSETRISFSSSEVNGVEASVENLKNMPIPSDVDKTDEAEGTDDAVGINEPHIHSSISSSLVHEAKLDNEAENGVLDVANGTDVNLSVDKAEEPPNPDDAVQVECVADDAAGVGHESEVNGVVSGLAIVQIAKPEIGSQNDPPDVENKSESIVDKIEGAASPCLNETAETEVKNDFKSVSDTQLPSEMNGSSSALSASVHDGKLETQADTSGVDAQETPFITVADSRTPQFQLNNVDVNTCFSYDTCLGSKAKNVPVNGGKWPNSLVDSVSLNTKISFGSFNCEEFIGKMGPKSCQKVEDPSFAGSRDLPHNDSASFTLEKTEGDIRGREAFNETSGQQHVADDLSEHKGEYVPLAGSGNLPHDHSALSIVAKTEDGINDRHAVNEMVCTVGINANEESTSSHEGSATDVLDGDNAGTETVKKPFSYLIKIPKFDDEKLTEQIQLAQIQLEEKTRSRDVVLAEYRPKKETCQHLKADQQASILQERTVRDLVRAKRKEIDSALSLVNIAKDAMTIEDLDNKIANMECKIQHETVPLNEEKKLIREIKQSKQIREQMLAGTKKQAVQQALDQKDKNEEHLKVLRKEMDVLKEKLSKAEQAVNAATKRFDCERTMLNELYSQYRSSDAARQEAYINLQDLRKQWSEKNKYFWSFKDHQRQANSYAVSGDKASLQSLCVNQVETVMKLWNADSDFRRDYIRCNLRSTLWRLGTLDGRCLGPDEEAPSLAKISARRINTSVGDIKEATPAAVQHKLVAESRKADTKYFNKVVEQKNQNVVTNRTNKASKLKNELAEASNTVKIEEDKEDLKVRKEEEELARKAEELREKEEAARLKEVRRLEEKAKALEALERKRRNAEKAQAKAEFKARKEAEEKEKEKEKNARKKEKKRGLATEDTTSNPENDATTRPEFPSESTKDPETRQRSVTSTKRTQKPQYIKQNKLKSIPPPPPPLRNRGRRRMQQWMWVIATIVAVLILFFLGNIDLSGIRGVFSSLH